VLSILLGVPVRQRLQQIGVVAWQRIAGRWPSLARIIAPLQDKQQRPAVEHSARKEPITVEVSGSVEELVRSLRSSPGLAARVAAAAELGKAPGDVAFDTLVEAVRDPSAEVACAAIEALASRADPRVTALLTEVLQNRDGYFNSLARAGAVSGLVGRGDSALGEIESAVADVDAAVSLAAIGALCEHSPQAARSVVAVLEDTSGYYLSLVRVAAATALTRARMLSPADASRLIGQERDPAVRAALEAV
jgi:HEAT repeat protein